MRPPILAGRTNSLVGKYSRSEMKESVKNGQPDLETVRRPIAQTSNVVPVSTLLTHLIKSSIDNIPHKMPTEEALSMPCLTVTICSIRPHATTADGDDTAYLHRPRLEDCIEISRHILCLQQFPLPLLREFHERIKKPHRQKSLGILFPNRQSVGFQALLDLVVQVIRNVYLDRPVVMLSIMNVNKDPLIRRLFREGTYGWLLFIEPFLID